MKLLCLNEIKESSRSNGLTRNTGKLFYVNLLIFLIREGKYSKLKFKVKVKSKSDTRKELIKR